VHSPTRDLKADWRPGDAAKLAQLFNEYGSDWPGGLGPRNTTPEEAERIIRESNSLAVFVAEADDRFVAYCDLAARRGGHYAYVPFLNAHPEYHGRGFGKAVLLSSIERAIALGYDRVVLHTWGGNLKAVPLYKKSGFMWAPETHVMMENFVPFALRHPLARPFFSRHNWYESQVRDLSLTEDVFLRGKVRAYQYLWRADGDMLRMVFDRQSQDLLEIETNELRAACYLPDEKITADMPHQVRWEIEAKTEVPLEAVIVTQPDPGISCSYQESLTVRRRAARSAQFVVDPDIPEKEREPYAPIIRSVMLINGQPLELAAGMEVRQAATVGVEPDFASLRPGIEQRMFLQVASHIEQPARATIAAHCVRGGRMKRVTATLDLRPRGRRRFPITLTPDRPGQVDITAKIGLKIGRATVRAKDARIALRAVGPRDLAGSVDEWQAILENAELRVTIERNGFMRVLGRGKLGSKAPWSGMMGARPPVVGPPYAWEEFFTRPRLDAVIEREDGAVVAILRSDSAQRPGVLLERRVILTHRPIIEIRDRVINTTSQVHELTISRVAWPEGGRGREALPGPDGIVQSPRGGAAFEVTHLQPPDQVSEWPEGWVFAGDERDGAAGLIWSGASRVEHAWGTGIKQPLGLLAPGASAEAPPLFMFAGRGGPEDVRFWWRALVGAETAPASDTTAPEPPITFGIAPSPPVIPPGVTTAHLFAKSFGRHQLAGRLSLHMPAGLRANRTAHAIRDLDGKHSFDTRVEIRRTRRARPGMHVGRAELGLDEAVYVREFGVLVPDDVEGQVEDRRDDGMSVVDAAPMHLRVDPSFSGCAISLRWRDRELLHTKHPKHPPVMWWNPWYGGIWPQFGALGEMGDLLAKEKFTARFVSRQGRSGVEWRGVAVSCSPRHERGRHLRLGLEYLLLPGAPVAAVVVSCASRVDAVTHFDVGADVWLSLGGKPTDRVRVRRSHEPNATRLRSDDHRYVHFDPWGIVENPGARCAVLLTVGNPLMDRCGVELTGRDGYHLTLRSDGILQPGGTSRAIFYLAFGETAGDAEPYHHLGGCAELP
jgi:GNAT superfamily N-acetyltransferase